MGACALKQSGSFGADRQGRDDVGISRPNFFFVVPNKSQDLSECFLTALLAMFVVDSERKNRFQLLSCCSVIRKEIQRIVAFVISWWWEREQSLRSTSPSGEIKYPSIFGI